MDLSEALGALGFGRKIFAGEHEEYRRSLRKFFQTKIEPNVRQWERDGFFPRSIFEQAGQAGLLGAAWGGATSRPAPPSVLTTRNCRYGSAGRAGQPP